MSGRCYVSVHGKKLKKINNLTKRFLGKGTKRAFSLKTNNVVFKVELVNKRFVRLDMDYEIRLIEIQRVGVVSGVIPNIISCSQTGKRLVKFKFSEWIDGVMLLTVWDLEKPFVKFGESVARLNEVKCKNMFLINGDMNSGNVIWTKDEEVYIIDLCKLKLVESEYQVDVAAASHIVKKLKNKKRAELFLEGYSKFRNISEIRKNVDIILESSKFKSCKKWADRWEK